MMPPAPVDSVLRAIGATPVVRLRRIVPPGSAEIVIKLESYLTAALAVARELGPGKISTGTCRRG